MHIDLTLSDSEDEQVPQLPAKPPVSAAQPPDAAQAARPVQLQGQQGDACVMLLSSDDEQEGPHSQRQAPPARRPSPSAGAAPVALQPVHRSGMEAGGSGLQGRLPSQAASGSGGGTSSRHTAESESDSDDELDLGFLKAAGARAASTGRGSDLLGMAAGPRPAVPTGITSQAQPSQGLKRPAPPAIGSQHEYGGSQQDYGSGYAAWGSQDDVGGTQGGSGRNVRARKGPVDKEAAKAAREEEKARKAEEKAAAKEAKAAERARLAAEKKAAKEGEKLARKAEKEVARAMSGTGADKETVVRLSTKMMESEVGADVIRILRETGYEYQVDASLPLGAEYACARFTRRLPRAAATCFFEGDTPTELAGPATAAGPPSEKVEVFFPLLLVFLSPPQLCAQLAEGRMLGPLRAAAQRAHPHCTLMVTCVGLERHLTKEERIPGSRFNRNDVLDALMDVAMQFPAVRLRTELSDGAQAAEFLSTTTRQLGLHHKKQQDGYLASFGADKIKARDPSLDGEPQSTRTLAHALSHLVTGGDKAIAVAKQYKSAAALLRAYQNPALGTKQRESLLLGISLGTGRAGTLGAKSAKDVYEYFMSTDPNAPWREEAGAGMD